MNYICDMHVLISWMDSNNYVYKYEIITNSLYKSIFILWKLKLIIWSNKNTVSLNYVDIKLFM